MESTRLSVNINKIALLRNARGGAIPNLLQVAQDCERFGAQGITIHPRPDERHIRYRDVYELKEIVTTEFNIEGYPDERFMNMVLEVKPHQCTLVPDPPGVLTSNAGWNTIEHSRFLTQIIDKLKNAGIRVSLFVETNKQQIQHAAQTGAHRIELYTGPYAGLFEQNRQAAAAPYVQAAQTATAVGLGVNAGHDLNLHNLRYLKQQIPQLLEVSIGHALICDALYYGLENTIQLYLRQLE
ncbi:pyridoxine 5'-phosphate synthase [Sphingobacteriales bacterium UPWRP_1]|nr:pyridoxine 5'-phosphate synthase [Sphingobacteriales bacterium TSM_CSM]PSJ74180.1 pyridoxine 5'-phosphate synthase [Sphingobacteriales bacterium UPWRP_1]